MNYSYFNNITFLNVCRIILFIRFVGLDERVQFQRVTIISVTEYNQLLRFLSRVYILLLLLLYGSLCARIIIFIKTDSFCEVDRILSYNNKSPCRIDIYALYIILYRVSVRI